MAPRVREGKLFANSESDEHEEMEEAAILSLTRHLIKPNGSILGREVAEAIRPHFRTFADAIPRSVRPALASIDGRRAVSHSRLVDFITNEFGPCLHRLGFGRGHRVALVLPNGPELAAAIMAVGHWASCVPLTATGATQEMQADLQRCQADVVIGPYSRGPLPPPVMDADGQFPALQTNAQDWTVFKPIEDAAAALGIPFVGLVPSPVEVGIFQLLVPRQESVPSTTPSVGAVDVTCNTPDDEILVLFTSGTTGDKKLVPHLLGDMLTAATTIALSWNLTPVDVNCNLMPLFHVGGIVRQVFAPLISGGCVICCPSFDPTMFWTLLEHQAFNWYYAAPTMHHVILQNYPAESFVTRAPPRLRMIANAAGGLLPSLAVQLRDRFGASVLPSYGMTECMPISSPPPDYDLTKPGTSGVPVGPEVAILNVMTMTPLPCNEEGPICVRGEPCMRGYGRVGAVDGKPATDSPETFLTGGWFNTGDLGYFDEDGYLYVTGRSKEVINRGGEIISPMEVEEAVSSHPCIESCAAFSAAHIVLQEVVGICVVMKEGRPRLDLPSLHEYLGARLAAPKWPQCLVFMDDLPKSHTNKLLRVKLGSRLSLPELNDDMTPLERTVQATCPPKGADLTVPIPVCPVAISLAGVQKILSENLAVGSNRLVQIRANEKRQGTHVAYLYQIDRMEAIQVAREVLDGYAVPTHFIEMPNATTFPVPKTTDAVSSILQSVECTGPVDPHVYSLQEIFADLLKLDYLPGPDASFFHLGGSSMMASQLASKIRKRFEVPCNGAEIFHHSSCNELAKMIRKRTCDDTTAATSGLNGSSMDDSSIDSVRSVSDHGAPFPPDRLPLQCSWGAALFQLVPMFIVFPIWQVTRYLLFFAVLMRSFDMVPDTRDVGTFVLSYLIFHILWITVTPLLFVCIKWLVIGRYRAGRYPIWSGYYLRWWFVDVCRKIFLRGIWGSHEFLLNFYLRLLGAKVGRGARISLECEIAEFDLVCIGDHASIELCTFRGFGVDNGAMILGPVSVGSNGSVGIKSVVAPYTSIPDDGHLGPVASTYDIKAIDPKYAHVNRKCLPEPNFWMKTFIGGPIEFFVNCVGQIPPLIILVMMLQVKGEEVGTFSTPSDLMAWLCNPRRVPFFLGIRIARAVITPFFYMATAIAVKWVLIGKFEAGPRKTNSQWQLLRHQLACSLFSRKKIQAVTDIIGRHYELVSILYRLLGAKVGKRVFWPGHQPISTGEFDLIEIGDDVVFGSRSALLCSTADSCERVVLCAGSNVADNCVVLPGSIIGKNAVLGSNSLCPEGWYLPEGSVWLGSKGGEPDCLDAGVAARVLSKPERKIQMFGDSSTLRPFGKAFYMGKATYFVWPLPMIVVNSVAIKVFIATFHALPLLGAFYGAAAVLYGVTAPHPLYVESQYTFSQVYFALLFVFLFMNVVRIVLWLLIELGAKWTLIGRRQPGTYNYDTCDYAQRWELYQLVSKLRKFSRYNFLQFFFGTPYMTAYFRWNGGNIGKDCCLYPSGADPFMPEPDLVRMGDRCVVDCASIVSHLNTRGNFDLQVITLENECTLRTRSRLQQGVYMEAGSQLLEKSLALTGEVIESDSVWQGGPASLWFQYSKKSTPYAIESFDSDDETTKLLSGKTVSYSQV